VIETKEKEKEAMDKSNKPIARPNISKGK